MFEVPEIIQKVLESMRNHELATSESYKPQKIHKEPLNNKKNQKSPKLLSPIGALWGASVKSLG